MVIRVYDRNSNEILGRQYVVTSEYFKDKVQEVTSNVMRKGLIILTGPKGIGKSVLARFALSRLVESGYSVVYEIGRRFGAEELVSVFAKNAHLWPVVLYDPLSPAYYEPEVYRAPRVVDIIDDLEEIIWAYSYLEHRSKTPRFLLVLPSDIFNAVRKDVEERARENEVESSVIELNLRSVEFLSKLVRISSLICGEEHYLKAGKLIAERHSDSYALIAEHVGRWLFHTKCSNVEEAVEAGDTIAKALIARHIYAVFYESVEMIKRLAPLLLTHITGQFAHKVDWPVRDVEREFIEGWLSQKHEGLIEEVINSLVNGQLSEEVKTLVKKAEARGIKGVIDGRTVKIIEKIETAIKDSLGQERGEKA